MSEAQRHRQDEPEGMRVGNLSHTSHLPHGVAGEGKMSSPLAPCHMQKVGELIQDPTNYSSRENVPCTLPGSTVELALNDWDVDESTPRT